MPCAWNHLPIVLVFTSLFVLEIGIAEKVKLVVSLNSRQDGEMVASVFVGNATTKTMKNLSLELDLDTILDNSQNLLGAEGFIKDSKRGKAVELSNCNDIHKVKESKRLWSFLCPDKGDELLHIVSRFEWGSKGEVTRQKRMRAADFLILDSLSYFANSTNFFEIMRNIETHQMKYFGDLWCNFWISDDGKVFEGIGMDYFNDVYNGGLGSLSLIVAFIKKEIHAAPSEMAITSFQKLIKNAICTKGLSLHYSLVPYYLIFDQLSISNDSFERKEMRKWESYENDLDILFPFESDETSALKIVQTDEWSSVTPKEDLVTLLSPIEYVVIMQYNARCFFNCTKYLRVVERNLKERNETMRFNFILTEDGRVYEVTGWGKTWHNYFQRKKAILVGFMGNFNSYGPRKSMFFALNGLIKDGLRFRILSPHYKLVTIKAVNPLATSMGMVLEQEIKKLDNYSNTI